MRKIGDWVIMSTIREKYNQEYIDVLQYSQIRDILLRLVKRGVVLKKDFNYKLKEN